MWDRKNFQNTALAGDKQFVSWRNWRFLGSGLGRKVGAATLGVEDHIMIDVQYESTAGVLLLLSLL